MVNRLLNIIGLGLHYTAEFIGTCIRWYFMCGYMLEQRIGNSNDLDRNAANALQVTVIVLNILWILLHFVGVTALLISVTEAGCSQ